MKYSEERNIQIVISLLKAHNINKIIASPGATNLSFVASVQDDPFFEIYSAVDERSAAYIACGLAAETGEPVVLSCTGATASRNYMPGMTEAFYRKLPVLAITSNAGSEKKYHLIAQQIDRSNIPNDTAKISVDIPVIKDDNDAWDANLKINKAILEMSRHGGGPAHINLATTYSTNYIDASIPEERAIKRIYSDTPNFPQLKSGRIAIFIGSHRNFNDEESALIGKFCEIHNSIVLCDHTSGYYGKYRVQFACVGVQQKSSPLSQIDTLIHFGEISGDYYTLRVSPHNVWRVSPDGELRDTFRKLEYVFEMSELTFLKKYCDNTENKDTTYWKECQNAISEVREQIPQMPFSNIWIAQQIAGKLPYNSKIHLGILNTLRSWNFFELAEGVESFCNVGGFGIDGNTSSLLGASLANPQKIYFGVVGDLSFLYDLNSITNRHISPNIRILLINNGLGAEFTNYGHQGYRLGDKTRKFIAAEGHFGHKSRSLIKHFAEDLGFSYICASNKSEFNEVYEEFISPVISDRPIIFEVFTNSKDESDALEIMSNIFKATESQPSFLEKIKTGVVSTIGLERAKALKTLIIGK